MSSQKLIDSKPFVQGDDKYRSIIDNMKLGLLEVDLNGIIQYANDSFCSMVEYSREELVGQSASELLLSKGSLSEQLVDEHSSRRLKGRHSVYEVQVTKKSGIRIWVMIGGGPLYNKKGEVIGTIGIHHDFSEKKRNEESLKKLVRELAIKNREFQQKQEYLKAINEFSTLIADKNSITELAEIITINIIGYFGFEDCIIYVLDENGDLSQASAFGPKKNEYGGVLNPIKIKVGEGIVGTVAKTHQAEIIEDTTADERYVMDDKLRLSEITVPIIYDGELLGVIDSEHSERDFFNQEHLDILTTLANLTASKLKSAIAWDQQQKVQTELEESESKFRNIINSALDAVIMIDSNGIITEWNDQSSEIFGFAQEEAVGESLAKLIIPTQHREAHAKGMTKFHKTGEGPVLNKRIEITAIGKNREEFPIELSISPIKLNDTYYFSAFLRDISEQKANQKKLERSLEREKELNEMKSKFVSMTSHEFRTPLTTIKSNIDLLAYRLEQEKDSSSPVFKNLGRIENEVERLTNLMNDILTIGRIESGKIVVNLQKVDFVALVKEIIGQSFANQADGRKANLKVKGKEQMIELDSQIFAHVISNLVSNAFKYSEGSNAPEIIINYKAKELLFQVKDYGIGIPESDRDKLFDSFHRASNVGNIQGSGMGLTIVQQFVKLHYGEMKMDSKLGEGTTVSVEIPY